MNEDQKTPPEQQPNIDQLITQANSQAYVFEHGKQKRSLKQWFLDLPRTKKVFLIAGTTTVIFAALMIGLSFGGTTKPSSDSNNMSTTDDSSSEWADTNNDGVIDAKDADSNEDSSSTYEAASSSSQSWWQKILNTTSTTRQTVTTGSGLTYDDGSDTSYVATLEDNESGINDGEDLVIAPSPDDYSDPGGDAPIANNEGSFSLIALPDTQREVQNDVREGTNLFRSSMQWIVANKDKRNIKAVVHSGDIVHASASTGSSKSTQMVNGFYATASKGFSMLDDAGIPYSIALGNHDTNAICSNNTGGALWCYGESTSKTLKLLGEATRFDKTYTTTRNGLKGLTTYNSGRITNSYRTFSSGDSKWLILTMEYLVPSDVFRWAQEVVRTHSDYNVVLVVHRYMSQGATILGSCEGSCTSPKKIRSDLVLRYSNVKLVFSGHAGKQAIKIDTSSSGNKVVQFQTTMHETTRNPLRLITIDTNNNTVTSRLCMLTSKSTESGCTEKKVSGMKYIKSTN